jgi:hypothetical protein
VPKTYDGEKSPSLTNAAGKTGYLHAENKLVLCLSPCTRMNSRWIKDLNIRPETLKLVQKEEQGIHWK